MMLSRRSTSIATHPMPPSDMATLSVGYFTAHADHSHSAHAVNDICPKRVAPNCTAGEYCGNSTMPDEPTCRLITVSVSAHARMIGSQYLSKIEGMSMRCGRSGNVTDRNPRAAL